MSTRCHIAFYNNISDIQTKTTTHWETLLYKHHDGYPEGILPLITPVLKEFQKDRGLDDIEYASAYLVSKIKDGVLDVGICKSFHSDTEYLYAICPKAIVVFEIECDWKTDDFGFKEIKRVALV